MSQVQIDKIRGQLDAQGIPALLISDSLNLGWASGFTGSSGMGLVTAKEAIFITDSRYTIQAADEVKGFEVVTFGSPMTAVKVLKEHLQKLGVSKLGFETSVTYATLEGWKKDTEGVEWVPAGEVLPPLRMIKSAEEVEKLRRACALADACFDHVCRMIQVGVSEYDIALDIEFFIRRQGAKLAFDVIAVSGPNSAKPHGRPSERKLEPGDFLTLDFGAGLEGYNSDLTRTVVVAELSERHAQIYNRVLEAQVAACEALKPGANGRDVDLLARAILDKDDLSKYFGHGLGHGLGMAVHDYGGLSQSRDQEILAGQVWTVEPGVYIPGFGGVRIEDDVHVTPDGPEILTHSRKELLVLGG